MAIQITNLLTKETISIGDITKKQQLYLLQSNNLYEALILLKKPFLADSIESFLNQPNLMIQEA